MLALFGKRDDVGEYKAAISDVEKRVGVVGEDIFAVVLVHAHFLESSKEIEIASSRGSKSNGGWLDFYEYLRSLYKIAHRAHLLDAVGTFVQAQSMEKC
ncbi:hypothetical protein Scep_016369 [Stephania cephalantha]|uniref:Uncharacterized protein n=1 Tax=Stephania cephalantha TaxID=152367 RepID=A0AAP0IP95_9MAGN